MRDGNGSTLRDAPLDAAADDLLSRLADALATDAGRDPIIDLRTVDRAGPALLRNLKAVADAARAAQRQVLLVGARPEVYKALHVAGLATAFRRV